MDEIQALKQKLQFTQVLWQKFKELEKTKEQEFRQAQQDALRVERDVMRFEKAIAELEALEVATGEEPDA